jgi:L-galactose dehydrogenase
MNYRVLGRTGLQVSAVSLGGAYLCGPDPQREAENAADVVARAASLGINYVDTAPLYGSSEELLGPALQRHGQDFHVATKVGFDPADFDYRQDSVLRSVERSLGRLRCQRLSVVQIHEVNKAGWERIMEPGGTLQGLRAAQARGLCDHIGVTGRAIPLLTRLAATGEFDTVLVYHDYHPCSDLAGREVIPAAAAANMGVVVATVLAGGLFVGGEPQEQVLGRMELEERRHAEPMVERLCRERSSLPQSAFRYVLADPRVSTVSSGAADARQLAEVAAAADMSPLVLA